MATKNDGAWNKYLDECNIRLNGDACHVLASRLKQVTGREPRLLAKFDTPDQLPKPFRDSGYVILAVKNGEYLLAPGNAFAPVPKENECEGPVQFKPRLDFTLITLGRGSGESQFLDMAHVSGLFDDFLGISPLYLTIRGRERTTSFSFELQGFGPIEVDSVQIEVDAGYEGEDHIVLVEAKVGSPEYLNIRQLYYPYRHFSKLFPRKKVKNLFFTYDIRDDAYTLSEFTFDPPEHFNAIRLYRCKRYRLSVREPREIEALIDPHFETENDIVPQADDFNKIISLLDALDEGVDNSEGMADHFGFTKRQSRYYSEAAEYLGFLRRAYGLYELTDSGVCFLALNATERREHIVKATVNSWVFRELVNQARSKGFFDGADIEMLIRSVQRDGKPRYTGTTVGRRRATIESWVRWLAEEFECFEEEQGTQRFYLR